MVVHHSRVLVVDDDEIICRIIRRVLAPEYLVAADGTAAGAIERLAAGERYEVILCDLQLEGEMDGAALYELLHQRYPEHARRIAIMTGGQDLPFHAKFFGRFPGTVLAKPFDIPQLRATVETVRARARFPDAPRP